MLNRILISTLLLLSLNNLVASNIEMNKIDEGILSNDKSIQYRLWGKILLRDDWKSIVNSYGNYCKIYNNNISLINLKKLLLFNYKDLKKMTPKYKAVFSKHSKYFETCNYSQLGTPFMQKVFDVFSGDWDKWLKPKQLIWGDTDLFLETEYTLLLLKNLGEYKNIPFKKRKVSVLFIRKDYQFASNREVKGGIFN